MKINKSFIRIACLTILLISVCAHTTFAYSGSQSYTDGQFSDVQNKDWFSQYVKIAYDSDLMKGTDTTRFSPYNNISIAEAVALSVRINSFFTGEELTISTATPWYQGYIQFAIANGILSHNEFQSYTQPISKFEFAKILDKAIPSNYLLVLTPAKDIPGAPTGEQGDCVYNLYRAGILTGSDKYKTFNSEEHITRAEIATIVSRIINPRLRISDYKFDTPQALVNYLNNFILYRTLLAPHWGGFPLKYFMMQNDMDFTPFDILIQVEISQGPMVWSELSHSISISESDKQETLRRLRDLQRRIYYYFSSYFPEYKISGGYINSWYRYPNLKVDLQVVRVMTWKNYEGDSQNYYDNKITEFHWDAFIDDYVFPEY